MSDSQQPHAVPPRALITGITGQDGSYLAELLIERGYEVHGLVRRSSGFATARIDHLFEDPHMPDPQVRNGADEVATSAGADLHYGDMLDFSSLRRLVEDVQPDEVYNLAAQRHVRVSFDMPEYTVQTIMNGTPNLLEAIRQPDIDVRSYQAGSSEMFGNAPEAPQSETTSFHPRSPYAAAKVGAHAMAAVYREAYGLFVCNGILFNHESPRRGPTFVTRKITRGIRADPARRGRGALPREPRRQPRLGLRARVHGGGLADAAAGRPRRLRDRDRRQPHGARVPRGRVRADRPRGGALRPLRRALPAPRRGRTPARRRLQGPRRARGRWRPRTTFPELVRIMLEADLLGAGLDPARCLARASSPQARAA